MPDTRLNSRPPESRNRWSSHVQINPRCLHDRGDRETGPCRAAEAVRPTPWRRKMRCYVLAGSCRRDVHGCDGQGIRQEGQPSEGQGVALVVYGNRTFAVEHFDFLAKRPGPSPNRRVGNQRCRVGAGKRRHPLIGRPADQAACASASSRVAGRLCGPLPLR